HAGVPAGRCVAHGHGSPGQPHSGPRASAQAGAGTDGTARRNRSPGHGSTDAQFSGVAAGGRGAATAGRRAE
ncbi:MAG TPA: hypothetical protein VN624_13150, partial [Rhodanobacter sp.]|nr:hypothetical protein [Rhodanobacter sp.]